VDTLQKFALGLSVFSVAGLCIIGAVYLDYRIEMAAVSDWGEYLKLSSTHPGDAIETLLKNPFYVVTRRIGGVVTSTQPVPTAVLFAVLFALLLMLSSNFILRIRRQDARSKIFLIAGVFNGIYYLIVLSGLSSIFVACYPNRGGFCGLFGQIVVAFAVYALLVSVVLLALHTYTEWRRQ
jgi:hypothetical protein